MPSLIRSAAPAVLVGGAALLVVGTANGGLAAAGLLSGETSAGGELSAVPDSGVTRSEPNPLERLFGDDDHDDDHDDDDYDDDGYSGARSYSAPGSAAAGSAGTGSAGSTAGSATGSCDATEVTGPVVRTEWGPVQVAAKISGGRVCEVRTIQVPDGDRKSVTINARAVPMIETQVLATGDASFDAVSGATVTSEGYRKSLQGVLDGA